MGMPATDTIDLRAMWYSENQYTAEFFGGPFNKRKRSIMKASEVLKICAFDEPPPLLRRKIFIYFLKHNYEEESPKHFEYIFFGSI